MTDPTPNRETLTEIGEAEACESRMDRTELMPLLDIERRAAEMATHVSRWLSWHRQNFGQDTQLYSVLAQVRTDLRNGASNALVAHQLDAGVQRNNRFVLIRGVTLAEKIDGPEGKRPIGASLALGNRNNEPNGPTLQWVRIMEGEEVGTERWYDPKNLEPVSLVRGVRDVDVNGEEIG